MDQTQMVEAGTMTPKSRRMSGNPMSNTYRGDQGRFPSASYTVYTDPGVGGQSGFEEEIDNSCVVYVNGLTNTTEDRVLFDTFRQFGNIVSLVRRSVNFDSKSNNSMTQYAFIGFGNPQDAQDAIRKGEITLGERKLTIRPRDKPGVSFHRSVSHGHHHPQQFKGFKDRSGNGGGDQILQLLNKNSRTGVSQQSNAVHEQKNRSPRHEQQAQQQTQMHDNASLPQLKSDGPGPNTQYGGFGHSGTKTNTNNNSGQPPVLMSKALYVANIPIDMAPKELFTLFSEVGLVEGCYIFPFADCSNRRFADIIMSSFYCAQKACEAFDGTIIRGCVLSVTYKTPAGPEANQSGDPPAQYSPGYPPPIQQPFPPPFSQQYQPPVNFGAQIYPSGPFGPQGQQVTWLPNYGPPNPNLVTPTNIIPFSHQFSSFHNVAQYAPFNVVSPISPPGFEIQHMNGVSPPTSPPFHTFQDPISSWQGQLPPRNIHTGRPYNSRRHSGRGGRHFVNSRPLVNDNQEHYRSTSNSSSATLTSHGYDKASFDGAITVNGSYMSSAITSEEYHSPPLIVNGSFTNSYETPSRHSSDGNTSESEKDSTPSPVVIRTLSDPKGAPETPTKPSPRPAAFIALSAPIIPETTEPADPANLYIKNLDPSVISTGEDLKKLFEPFGTVSSFVLATYPNTSISRGYGFVAFLKPEDASTAKAKLDRSIVGSRRVFVTWAETKEVRMKRLKDLFNAKEGAKESNNTTNKPETLISEDAALIRCPFEAAIDNKIMKKSEDTTIGTPLNETNKEVSEPGAVGKSTEKILEDCPPLIIAEQETIVNRWRGTQLTGIAEVAEDEEPSRTTIQRVGPETTPSPSLYKAPCIVRSPNHLEPIKTTMGQAKVMDQSQVSTISPKSDSMKHTKGANKKGLSPQQLSIQFEKCNQRNTGKLMSEPPTEQGDTVQTQHQTQSHGNGNNNGRYFYRNNNHGGNAGSRLPVPRHANTGPAPQGHTTSARAPHSNNGGGQQPYSTFPNNEPLGQQGSGKKKGWKNSNRRTRDSIPATHQQQGGPNQQPNDGIMNRSDIAVSAS